MKNGITIDGQAHELIETNEAYPYKCDHCSLLDKCVDFWGPTKRYGTRKVTIRTTSIHTLYITQTLRKWPSVITMIYRDGSSTANTIEAAT